MDAAAWDARYAGSDRVWSVEPNRWVAEIVPGLMPGRALDMGAGEGRNAIWLAERGWQVEATDFSAVAVHRIRQEARDRDAAVADSVHAWVADATAPSRPGERARAHATGWFDVAHRARGSQPDPGDRWAAAA